MRFKRRNLLPTVDVLAWLQTNHPSLHEAAELDRAWTWLAADPQDAATVESLKAFGFSKARHGHALKSGRMGLWAHPGTQPIPFRRRGYGYAKNAAGGAGGGNNLDAEIDAILRGVAA